MTPPTSSQWSSPNRVGRRGWLAACLVVGLPLATACSDDAPADTPNDSSPDMNDESSDATDETSAHSVMFPNGSVVGETPSDASESTP